MVPYSFQIRAALKFLRSTVTLSSVKRAATERGGWSTPVVIEASGRRELVLSGQFGVNAYDPTTGGDLWFCKSFAGRGEPMPVYAHGLLYVVSGLAGNTYAVGRAMGVNQTRGFQLVTSAIEMLREDLVPKASKETAR